MNVDPENQPPNANAEVEREIRQGRKLTAKDVMARMAGPGAMKGASPISPVQQAETEIGSWLRDNIADDTGIMPALIHRNLKGSQLLLDSIDQPLAAVAGYCQQILDSDYLLKELVREADVEGGQAMDERPHFEREGVPGSPDDPYTVRSVRQALSDALRLLKGTAGSQI